MKNIFLKIISIIMALFIWYFVNSESNFTVRSIRVPIDYENIPQNKVVTSELNKQVEVRLRGPSYLVLRLEASPPVIKIVLPSEVGDRYSRILSRDDLDVVTPVQVIDISPSRVEVAFQPKLSRDLRINAPKVVGLSSDFRVAEIKLNPEVVNVVGAASEIRALSDIELEPVDLTGEVVPEDGKVVERPLIIRVPGRFVDILPGNETKISLTIVPITSERTLSKLPVEVRSQGDINFKIIPSSVDVVVSGLKSKIEALKDKDIIPYAKVYSDFSDNQKFPVLVDLPGSIKVIRTVPDFLTVRRDSRKRIDTSRSKGSK